MKGIHFLRTVKMHEPMRALVLQTMDDPRYKYFHSMGYLSMIQEFTDYGWGRDAYLIMVASNTSAGYISWHYSRSTGTVEEVAIILKPEYLGKGVGPVALAKWLNYMMVDRRVRKIEFTCLTENEAVMRLYTQVTELGGRIIGESKKARKLLDGKYYDQTLFEILREDFASTEQFKVFVER